MKMNIASFFRWCRNFISNSFQWCWRHISSFWLDIREIPSKLLQFRIKEKPLRANFTPEMESIMNKLIRSTVGTGGALDREFMKQSSQYDADNPIGEIQARELLHSLLTLAVANREKINGRIEHSVEFGSLYYRYYSKLQTVYDLTVETNVRREALAEAQQEYYFAHNLYNNVREMTYSAEAIKKNTKASYSSPAPADTTQGGNTL